MCLGQIFSTTYAEKTRQDSNIMYLIRLTCSALASPFAWLALLLAATYVALLPPHKRGWLKGKPYVMPPGPTGYPLVGHLPVWLRYRNGGKTIPWLVEQSKYGELTTMSMGTKTWVLINSSRMVQEIIIKRGSITHERPYFPIVAGLVSRNQRLFLKKTEDWKEGRKAIHGLMMGPGAKDHGDIIDVESLGMLRAYMNEPDQWYAHNYRFPMSVINKIATNQPMRKTTKELEDLQDVTTTFLTAINSCFVEFYPFLASLPKGMQFWRRHWEDIGLFHRKVFQHWWKGMRPTEKSDPDRKASFVQTMLQDFSGDEEATMYSTMIIFAAGADNPRMTLNAWVMACLAYPETMKKARQELDRICGPNAERLPTLEDIDDMPYMAAVAKEVLRWRPTVPMVPPRVLVQDLEFEDYRFPAGTEFYVNSVAACRHGFQDAGEFIPERWLDADGKANDVQQTMWSFAFSGGRRSCVGYRLAQKEMFLSYARLLYCFDFAPVGEVIPSELNAFSVGEPFPAKISVRSGAHEQLIRREAERCEYWEPAVEKS